MTSEKGKWNISLSVEPSNQRVLATLTYTNSGVVPLALYKWNTCLDNQIHNDIFEIQNELGTVSYSGRLVKRGEPKADDFIPLLPGDKYSCKVDLALFYEFPSGRHRYNVRYSVLNPYLGRPGFEELKSNEVAFESSSQSAELVTY